LFSTSLWFWGCCIKNQRHAFRHCPPEINHDVPYRIRTRQNSLWSCSKVGLLLAWSAPYLWTYSLTAWESYIFLRME
jgi:hypothetical protein